MKKLLLNGAVVDIYFRESSSRTDILMWIEAKLSEIKYEEFTTSNGRNIFNLNEPYSCQVFDCSSVISKNNNSFIIRGDDDYKLLQIAKIKPVL